MSQPSKTKTQAQWVNGQLWVHMNGRTFVYEGEGQQKARSRNRKSGTAGDLLAPMPGKVTKVLGQAGHDVQKGEAILVMEAMKMEYTLKAEGPGRIEQIACKPGDQVVLGQVLVKVKPQE